VKREVPNLEFDWTRGFLSSVAMFIAFMGVFFVYSWFVPPIIRVNEKGISRQEGDQVSWRLRADIQRIIVDRAVPDQPQLQVETSNGRPLACGVGAGMNGEALVAFLRKTFPERVVEERK